MGSESHRPGNGIVAGVDTGGTFTDAVIVRDGEILIDKVPSQPSDPSLAVQNALKDHLVRGREAHVRHGSTVATNALLEGRGAKTALVTNRGFEDLIEIGRQNRTHLWALHPTRPEPLVPRALRFGIEERSDANGTRIQRASADELRDLADMLKERGVESIAIGLLHSYTNDKAELEAARALKASGIPITTSSEVVREFREYERFSTAVINAYVKPLMSAYLNRLESRLRGSRVFVMQSNGGTAPVKETSLRPCRTVLSGPAGGVIGATHAARASRLSRVITLDMGGTSTDVALIDGEPAITHQAEVEGRPLLGASIDIETIGAGGGSLAWIDPGGALRVGPQSAGADPGPACYGRGERATVTDAHCVLGRLSPDGLLGGRFPLDVARAKKAVRALATDLGIDAREAAEGILTVADASMMRAIRSISLDRGRDPRDFGLLAFGGAGGLHAVRLARALEMPEVLIPRHAGVLSAVGMAVADTRRDVSQGVLWSTQRATDKACEKTFTKLETQAKRELAREVKETPILTRTLDCRYVGQSHEIAVTAGEGWQTRFHDEHKRLFGHAFEDRPLEVVALRVRATVPASPLPVFAKMKRTRTQPKSQGSQRSVFGGASMPVYERERLRAGHEVQGPSMITEMSGTTLVERGARAIVDSVGNLRISPR